MNEANESDLKAAVTLACNQAGGTTALAKALGIRSQAVSQWKKVPAERLGEVHRVTGLSLNALRPDMFPAITEKA